MFRGSALRGALRHVASKNCGKRAPVRVADETRRWTPASARRALSTPGPAQVGFIGLGNMGSAMAANIVKARGSALVHDVSTEAVHDLVSKGALAMSSPAHLAAKATIIVSMLPSPKVVSEVFQGGNGLLKSAGKGTVFIDCSTIDPTTARSLHAECKALGHHFIDAPVSGGVIGATNATLTFMAGGDTAAVQMGKDVLLHMGKKVIHCGDAGSGQAAKLCNNLLLGISMGAVCEAMQLGTRLGVDAKVLASVINSSSGRCWSSDTYNPCPDVEMDGVPSTREYQGGFACDLMLKDLHLAQQAAVSCDLPLPLATSVQALYSEMSKRGRGGKDFSGIFTLHAS